MRVLTNLFGVWVPRTWVVGGVAALLLALLTLLVPAGPSGLVAFGGIAVGAMGMIMDELAEFADATTITTATGRALLGDVMDLGSIGRDIGNGQTVYLVIEIDTAVTSAGAATVDFELVSDAQAAIAVDGTATIHLATGAIGKATLVAGYKIVKAIPADSPTYERYLGVISNPAVAALTAGNANAFLTLDPSGNKHYADAL